MRASELILGPQVNDVPVSQDQSFFGVLLKTEGGMGCIVTGLQYALKNGLAVTTKPAVLNFLQLGYQVAKRLQMENAFAASLAESMPLLTASAA